MDPGGLDDANGTCTALEATTAITDGSGRILGVKTTLLDVLEMRGVNGRGVPTLSSAGLKKQNGSPGAGLVE